MVVTIGASDAREVLILDSQFGAGVITIGATTFAPATWYLGISTTFPNDDGTNFTEPSGGSYARVAIANNSTNFPGASTVSGVTSKSNGAKFTFPNPTANWGQIVAWGFFTASSGGIPHYTNQLDTAITVNNGNTPVEFDVQALVLQVD